MEIKKKNLAVDLTDLALGIVILGIVVSIGANILVGVRDTSLTDSSISTANNESADFTSASSNTLTNSWFEGINSVVNTTNGAVIGAGNYSVSTSDATGIATISNLTKTFPYEWNVSYDYYDTTGNPSWSLADDAATGLSEYGDWFDIIIIVGIAAVIVALIFMAFGRGGSSTSVGGTY